MDQVVTTIPYHKPHIFQVLYGAFCFCKLQKLCYVHTYFYKNHNDSIKEAEDAIQ